MIITEISFLLQRVILIDTTLLLQQAMLTDVLFQQVDRFHALQVILTITVTGLRPLTSGKLCQSRRSKMTEEVGRGERCGTEMTDACITAFRKTRST